MKACITRCDCGTSPKFRREISGQHLNQVPRAAARGWSCMHKSINIRVNPQAAATARGFVRDTLTLWNLPLRIEDAEIVVSELATNAIRYGGPPLVVNLDAEAGKICIE